MPKAVLVAHILGLPANLAPIRTACERYGVLLIEDAAEALGASYIGGTLSGQQVGTVGELGCYSFNGNKIITSGGGGMVTTADPALAKRAKHLATQAKIPGPEYLHDEIGFNYRLTNIAAALGVAQLEQLKQFLKKKREIAHRYDEAFGNLPGITLPPRPEWATPSMWLYSLLVDETQCGIDRRLLHAKLEARGIQTRPVWAPAHLMPFYKDAPYLGSGVGETIFNQGLSLPCSVSLSESEQNTVIESVISAVKH